MSLFTLPKVFHIAGSTTYPGAKLYFYSTGTTTDATVYTDSARSVAHSQPVVSDANGVFEPIWLDPTVTYRVQLKTSADVLIYDVDPYPGVGFDQSEVGVVLWPQTAAETTAGVTPTYYYYEPGDIRRYGAVGDGVTDDTAALQTAIAAAWSGNYTLQFPAGVFLTTGLVHNVDTADRDKVLRIRGAGYGEPFAGALAPAEGSIIRRVTDGPVLLIQSTGTATQSTGTIDIEGVFFDGDTTDAVVRFAQFYGISRFVGNVIVQGGGGNGLQIDYGATSLVKRCYAMNGDAFTSSLGAARTGIGFYIRNAGDAGLQSVENCTARGFLTGYQIGDSSGYYLYSPTIRQSECSVVYNGIILTSDCRGANIDDNYMEGGEGGTGILDQGDYNRITGNFIFPGFATGIDLTSSTKGNVCRDNLVSAGSTANSKLIKVTDSGSGKVVSNNHLSFGGSGGSISGVVGLVIAGASPQLDLSGNTFDPAGAWVGGAGTSKFSDASTGGGVVGFSTVDDTSAGSMYPLLSRGVISLAKGLTLGNASVSSNVLTIGASGYNVLTCSSSQTINSLSPTSLDGKIYVIRTTNNNATFANTASLKMSGSTNYTPGANGATLTFLIDSNIAYEIARIAY